MYGNRIYRNEQEPVEEEEYTDIGNVDSEFLVAYGYAEGSAILVKVNGNYGAGAHLDRGYQWLGLKNGLCWKLSDVHFYETPKQAAQDWVITAEVENSNMEIRAFDSFKEALEFAMVARWEFDDS